MRKIEGEVLDTPIKGVNLRGKTFGDQFGDRAGATLLVFLRHLGCIFCRENVKDLRALSARRPAYPNILFVYQGTMADGEQFFDRFWAEARAVADLQRRFYTAFGLQRGNLVQLYGPAVWRPGLKAALKGNFIGKPLGDRRLLSAYFLVQDRRIIWEHRAEHIGDRPDFERLPEKLIEKTETLAGAQ